MHIVSLHIALCYEAFHILAHINHRSDSKLLQRNDPSLCGFFRASPRCTYRCNYLKDDMAFMWCKLSLYWFTSSFNLTIISLDVCFFKSCAPWRAQFLNVSPFWMHFYSWYISSSSKWQNALSGLGREAASSGGFHGLIHVWWEGRAWVGLSWCNVSSNAVQQSIRCCSERFTSPAAFQPSPMVMRFGQWPEARLT